MSFAYVRERGVEQAMATPRESSDIVNTSRTDFECKISGII